MQFPQYLKPAISGFIVGGIATAIVGFSWAGWMTGSGADAMAAKRAQSEVIAALVPVCVDLAAKDPNRVATLAAINAASSYRRKDVVMEAGWATVPGAKDPDRDLATACVAELSLDAS